MRKPWEEKISILHKLAQKGSSRVGTHSESSLIKDYLCLNRQIIYLFYEFVCYSISLSMSILACEVEETEFYTLIKLV